MAPDRHVHHDTARSDTVQQLIQDGVDARAFETDIGAQPAGQLPYPCDHVFAAGIQDVVGYAGRGGNGFPCFAEFGDDDGQTLGFEHRAQEQVDGAGAADERDVACLGSAADEGVVPHRQRLDQGGLVQRDAADRMHPAAFDDDLLAEPASAAGQADEPHLDAQVVPTVETESALAAGEVRFDDDVLADLEVDDAGTGRRDGPGELVPHGHWLFFVGQRMWMPGSRDEDRALQVLVQVRATDAAPGDVDRHRAGSKRRFFDVLYTDVLAPVETCSLHQFASPGGAPTWAGGRRPLR